MKLIATYLNVVAWSLEQAAILTAEAADRIEGL